MIPMNRRLLLVLLALLVAGPLLAAATSGANPEPIRKVETKLVCMINDQVFARDQIPVAVNGKTYYGCCDMCKERLAKDAAAREAVDPVSGKKVDKATAVIGALADGTVLYFESDKTFEAYQKRATN